MVLDFAVLVLQPCPNQTSHFGSLVIHEQQARDITSIRPRILLSAHEHAGKFGAVGKNQAWRAVGLDEIDAMHRELVERLAAQRRESAKHADGEYAGENSRINRKKSLVGEQSHVLLLKCLLLGFISDSRKERFAFCGSASRGQSRP